MIGSLSVVLFFVSCASTLAELRIHNEPSMYEEGNKWVLNGGGLGAGKTDTFSEVKSVPVSSYPLHHDHSSSSNFLNSGLINLPETLGKQSYPVYHHDATSTASEHHGHLVGHLLDTPSVELDQPEHHTVYASAHNEPEGYQYPRPVQGCLC